MFGSCSSFGVDEDLLSFLFLLFEISFFLTHAHMLFFPVFGANWVTSGLDNDTLEGFDSLAHLRVQLLLHRVNVVGHVLAESGHKGEWLLDCLRCRHVNVCHL